MCVITLIQKWFEGSVEKMARVRFIYFCQRKAIARLLWKVAAMFGALTKWDELLYILFIWYNQWTPDISLCPEHYNSKPTMAREGQKIGSFKSKLCNNLTVPNNRITTSCRVMFCKTKRALCSIRLTIFLEFFDFCLSRVWLLIAL